MGKLKFRLDTPTPSFLADADTTPKTPIMIPAQSQLTLVGGDMSANGIVDVEWNGNTLKMFASDLRAQGKLVASAQPCY